MPVYETLASEACPSDAPEHGRAGLDALAHRRDFLDILWLIIEILGLRDSLDDLSQSPAAVLERLETADASDSGDAEMDDSIDEAAPEEHEAPVEEGSEAAEAAERAPELGKPGISDGESVE
jgi:hypothetical protein